MSVVEISNNLRFRCYPHTLTLAIQLGFPGPLNRDNIRLVRLQERVVRAATSSNLAAENPLLGTHAFSLGKALGWRATEGRDGKMMKRAPATHNPDIAAARRGDSMEQGRCAIRSTPRSTRPGDLRNNSMPCSVAYGPVRIE